MKARHSRYPLSRAITLALALTFSLGAALAQAAPADKSPFVKSKPAPEPDADDPGPPPADVGPVELPKESSKPPKRLNKHRGKRPGIVAPKHYETGPQQAVFKFSSVKKQKKPRKDKDD